MPNFLIRLTQFVELFLPFLAKELRALPLWTFFLWAFADDTWIFMSPVRSAVEGRQWDYAFLLGVSGFRTTISTCLSEPFISTTGLNFSLLAFNTNVRHSHLLALPSLTKLQARPALPYVSPAALGHSHPHAIQERGLKVLDSNEAFSPSGDGLGWNIPRLLLLKKDLWKGTWSTTLLFDMFKLNAPLLQFSMSSSLNLRANCKHLLSVSESEDWELLVVGSTGEILQLGLNIFSKTVLSVLL